MAEGASQVMQQRRLRAELRRMRDTTGHTQRAVADSLGWSVSKVIRIETGAVHVSTSDVMALLHFYGVSDQDTTTRLLDVTRAKEKSWWDAYRSVHSQQFLEFIAYEDSALRVRQFIGYVVPGLLQIEDYTRAIIRGYESDEEKIERSVRIRKRRQQILDPDAGREIWFIIDEAALHRWIGGPAVARAQLVHLKEMARQPNISIRVIPFSAGMHIGMRASFTLLEFPSDEDLIVNIEDPYREALVRDDLQTTSEFVEAFYSLQEVATQDEDLDKIIDSVLAGISPGT
ncbi:helix-turn-helix domain-containing protein [Actinophytocola sediminis]